MPDREDDVPFPHPPEQLIPGILVRGRAAARSRARRRRLQRALPPVLALLLAGAALGLRLGDGPSQRVDTTRPVHPTQLEVGPTPTPTTGPATPGPGPGDLDDLPPPGATPTPATGAGLGTGSGAGAGAGASAAGPPKVAVVLTHQVGSSMRSAYLPASGAAPIDVTEATAEPQVPSLSPDGRTLLFDSTKDNPVEGLKSIWRIYRMPIAGGEAVPLTSRRVDYLNDIVDQHTANGAVHPDWSPDARRYVYACSAPRDDFLSICTATPSGRDVRVVADQEHRLFFPRWSPDGRWIAALSDPGAVGHPSLWVLPADGRGSARLVRQGADQFDDFLQWSPDSAHLLVHQRGADGGEMVAIDVATGASAPVAGLPHLGPFASCGAGRVVFVTFVDWGAARAGDLVAADLADGGRPEVLLRGALRIAPDLAAVPGHGEGYYPTSCRVVAS